MLAKPFTFLLVFLLTIINFIILLVPVSLLFFPIFLFFKSIFIQIGFKVFFYVVSRISGAIILYIILDTIFGFTMRQMRKGCMPIEKASFLQGSEDIIEAFEWLKDKFKVRRVKLYLDPGLHVVNAYAIGSFSGSTVTITLGLINQIRGNSNGYEQFIDSVRAILGHEMSHLANKDFIPGLLAAASQSANDRISGIIRFVFMAVAKIFGIIPWIGWIISQMIIIFYNITNFILNAFYRFVFMPIYKFMMNFFGRAIEYRCDRESAYAYGGQKMATALGMLGGRGYFSLFSTHPTTKSRVRAVHDIIPEIGTIRPEFFNILANFLSISLIISIFAFSTYLTNIPNLSHHYNNSIYQPINYAFTELQRKIMKYYFKYNNRNFQ
jgi:Zn-dependent protease with chaperone function